MGSIASNNRQRHEFRPTNCSEKCKQALGLASQSRVVPALWLCIVEVRLVVDLKRIKVGEDLVDSFSADFLHALTLFFVKA